MGVMAWIEYSVSENIANDNHLYWRPQTGDIHTNLRLASCRRLMFKHGRFGYACLNISDFRIWNKLNKVLKYTKEA